MKTNLILFTALVLLFGTTGCHKTCAPASGPVVIKKMILARVFVKPENIEEFISAARVIIENTQKEPGCLAYQLYQDPVKKTDFIFVESYKDQAAIDAHFAASYFKEFGSKIGGMTSGPGEVKIIDVSAEK